MADQACDSLLHKTAATSRRQNAYQLSRESLSMKVIYMVALCVALLASTSL